MTKPDDIPQDVWEQVGDGFFAVANNHHAWGALEQLSADWANELQERFARAIMAERERCAGIVFSSYRSRSELCYKICRAIRNLRD